VYLGNGSGSGAAVSGSMVRQVDVHLFGSIRIQVGPRTLDAKSFGGRKPKQVLEQLLLRDGRQVSTDELAGGLWGDQLPPDYNATVQHYVSVLRRRLRWGAPWLSDLVVTERAGYRIDTSLTWLDLAAFDEVVDAVTARGRRQLGGASPGLLPGPDRATLTRALELVGGDVLEDEPDSIWAAEVRERYRGRHGQLALAAGAAALADGDGAEALVLGRLAVNRQTAAELPYCLLMAAHCLLDDRMAAVAAFDACGLHLADTLGVDPLPRTRAVRDAVLDGTHPQEIVRNVLHTIVGGHWRPEVLRLSA
jgi:SARP family transcriptional regulator, regulator of embCAB operon